jgi:hypothetical protein
MGVELQAEWRVILKFEFSFLGSSALLFSSIIMPDKFFHFFNLNSLKK